MDILSQLNEEQLKPVLDTEGAVLVLAGAGSGKTRVLTTRISYLVTEKRVPSDNVLAITFTNKAANEMKERLDAVCDISRMWVCTIHSMCVRILRAFGDRAGLTPNFSIYSEQERAAVIKQSFKECGFEDEDGLLKAVKFHISEAKMQGLNADAYLARHGRESKIETAMAVYRKYDEHLKSNNALDFDDLLLRAKELLSEEKEVLEYYADKFRYIHVDEFQDTNAVQFEIINLLASKHGNLFVVGDDDQSIYGWRGAVIGHILHFEQYYPKMKLYKLERNYRSTKAILSLANASISHNRLRKGKTLWTNGDEGSKPVYYEADEETGEALYCARCIAEFRRYGLRYSDFAVLMRVNALTRSYEQEFTKYGIPYKVFGGFKFYERKEIKDILAYLRVCANPFDDEAVMRIINVPRRGIGEKTVQTLLDYAMREELSLYDAVLDSKDMPFTAGTKEKLKAFGDYIKNLVIMAEDERVDKLTSYVVNSSGMYGMYADGTDEGITKRANIDEFINSVDEFVRLNGEATLSEYLQQITLYSDTDEMDDGDYVTLATIHAVKGLEYKCVFLVGLEENIMPVSRAIDSEDGMEEERRLMYVAITRARERLYLTRSKSRYLYGRREPTMRSEFVEELKDLLDLPVERPVSYGYSNGMSSGRGYGYGGGYSGYSGARTNGAVKRVGSYSAGTDEGYRTFGTGKPKAPSVSRVTATAQPKKEIPEFAVGMRVRHAKFGEGEVVGLRGASNNIIVTVQFESAGRKDLAAALAPLEIL